MDFGLFNLLQHRDRSKTSQDLINEALEHTRAAEELGFSRVWFAEHHGTVAADDVRPCRGDHQAHPGRQRRCHFTASYAGAAHR
jgi:alkanesulfonate monooxygenase SsuD/methylene tetrahydromethanopterin reductase-like flavin-dependent oxidoreductase (luciferase family)